MSNSTPTLCSSRRQVEPARPPTVVALRIPLPPILDAYCRVFSSLEYLLRIYVANERISCGETSPKNCSRAREGVLGFWRSESRIRSDNWRNRKHPRSIFDKKNMKGFHIENQDRDRVRICRPGPKDANQIRISAKICQNEIGILNRGSGP